MEEKTKEIKICDNLGLNGENFLSPIFSIKLILSAFIQKETPIHSLPD